MKIVLDHFTLPSRDADRSARFVADIFDLPYEGTDHRGFAEVTIGDVFTLIYVPIEPDNKIHLAFHVDEEVVDRAIAKLKAMGEDFGSQPTDPYNLRDDHPFGGRGIFFHDPNGHFFELMTKRTPG
jgi:catechol 2,3-dioxygenase-like lactoylglutathione lyase family enzyme